MSGRFQGNLPERTFEFSLKVLDAVDFLPNNAKGWAVSKQLLRCGTSVGANVHEAGHAISDADFTMKCSIARKEAAETWYWLRLCHRAGLLGTEHVSPMIHEADEIVRILSTIVRKSQQARTAAKHD